MASTSVIRHIAAPPGRVYTALLDADSVQQWMVPDDMTSVVHRFEPHEGGVFEISLTYDDPASAGKTSGATDSFQGRFVRLVPDSEVVQSVAFDTDDPSIAGEMTITYTLVAANGGTDLTGRHDGLPDGVPTADNELGWQMSLAKLAALVEP